MKAIYTIVALFLFIQNSVSQQETDIFLLSIQLENDKFGIKEVKNISKNPGYDNQPSFLDNSTIMFASTRNGQTDIAQYHTKYGTKSWVNFSAGSEYSPLKIPNEEAVTAIKLEADGTQQLWTYSLRNGESRLYKSDLKIGYQLWFNKNILMTSVLENDQLALYKTEIALGTNKRLESNVGRSLNRIPNTELISYISKESSPWLLKSMNPLTGSHQTIITTLENSEDHCWLNDGSLLMGQGNKLYRYHPKRDKTWVLQHTFDSIGNITRMAVSPDNSLMAIVGEGFSSSENLEEEENSTGDSNQAESIVQSHIAPYNNKNIDGFLKPFAENVKVYQFPVNTLYSNKAEMRKGYVNYFRNNKKLNVRVNNRMSLKNVVIDEEISTVNETTNRQVSIYHTSDNAIETMNFITNSPSKETPETIVNRQLAAYNNRDIDTFLDTYSYNVQLFDYPRKLSSQGKEAMRKQYGNMFKNIPDLNAEIVKRFVIGNKVVDKEKVMVNGKTVYAIAIYEIENGLIKTVTFIQ